MIYTLTLFNWMRNTKTDTLINGPNLKNDTQFKEKTKPYEFNRNTQIFPASLPQYSKERFSSWFVSRQAGHLRTWKLTDIITLPYPAKISHRDYNASKAKK